MSSSIVLFTVSFAFPVLHSMHTSGSYSATCENRGILPAACKSKFSVASPTSPSESKVFPSRARFFSPHTLEPCSGNTKLFSTFKLFNVARFDKWHSYEEIRERVRGGGSISINHICSTTCSTHRMLHFLFHVPNWAYQGERKIAYQRSERCNRWEGSDFLVNSLSISFPKFHVCSTFVPLLATEMSLPPDECHKSGRKEDFFRLHRIV